MGYALVNTTFAPDAVAGDEFGRSVALSSNGLVKAVGAHLWETGDDSSTPDGFNRGAVYVFQRATLADAWNLRGSAIVPADGAQNDEFGTAVALSADGVTVFVGAPRWEGAVTDQGGVYTFDWNGSSHVQRGGVLISPAPGSSRRFGDALACDGPGTALVVRENVSNGTAWTFDWSGAAWGQRGGALSGTAGSNFSSSLALSDDGNVLAVGAIGIVSVLIFDRSGSAWTQRGSAITHAGGTFGRSVALSDNGAVLHAGKWSSGTSNQEVVRLEWTTVWTVLEVFSCPSTLDGAGAFSRSVASNGSGSVLVVGAYGTDSVLDFRGASHTFDYAPPPTGVLAASYRPTLAATGVYIPVYSGALAGGYRPAMAAAGGVYDAIRLPIELAITSAAENIALPLVLQIVPAESVALPLAVTVIDPATQGGLNGAGGWAAAPDGRWQAVVVLDGVDISARLVGAVVVRCADNEARTADFAFRPAATLAPMGLIGRRVAIAFARRGAADAVLDAQTIFTGVVEQPSVDLANGVVACACHDQFQEVLANTPRPWFDTEIGGRWSLAVSGEPADNRQYAFDRLASVPRSLALDALQRPVVLAWRGLADSRVVQAADVVDDTLTVELPSRAQLRTRIDVRMQYRYPVIHNRGIVSAYSKGVYFFIRDASAGAGPILWLTTAMVEGALDSLDGWERVGDLRIEHPAPGSYPLGVGGGAYIIEADVAPDLALGWSAYFKTRWRQTRTEDYTLSVVALNLESLIGAPVAEEMGVSLEAPDVDEAWHAEGERLPGFTDAAPTEGQYLAAKVGDTAAEPAGEGYSRADFEHATRTVLDQAWVRLWDASRSGRVRLTLPLRPDIWLATWLDVTTSALHAAGKVVEITHTLDAEAGTATSEIAMAVGLPGNTPASLPAWTLPATPTGPATDYDLASYCGKHDTFIGGRAASPTFNEKTMIGFVTNLNTPASGSKIYPHQLTVEAPEIPAEERDPLDLPVASTFFADVPTDLLELL